jgi:hypothetical protein
VKNEKKERMTPLKAIRRVCIDCVESAHEVRDCGGNDFLNGQDGEDGVCYVYQHRMGTGKQSVKNIRKFCLECLGGSYQLVEECENLSCPVHQYRLGKNPKRAGQVNKGSFTRSLSRA